MQTEESRESGKEQCFHIEWHIDLYARTPEEAARKALAIQRGNGTATLFSVYDEDGNEEVVDLNDIDFDRAALSKASEPRI